MMPISSNAKEEAAPKSVERQETPVTKWLDAENALIEPLSEKDKETFFILRNKHSVIRTLRVVRDDIKVAVKLCAKENEILSEEIKTRFKDWEGAVLPILKEANMFLTKEINEQETVPRSQARKVLKLNDKAHKFSQSKIKKQPISDEKSCRGLIKSMDKTENDLISLLQVMLLPEEVIKMRLEQEKKAEKASK
jgi:hypothetical protein